jgi:hypothetical protein
LKLTDLPTILPSGRATVPHVVSPRIAGDSLSAQSKIYLEWRGRLIEVPVTVAGRVIDSK